MTISIAPNKDLKSLMASQQTTTYQHAQIGQTPIFVASTNGATSLPQAAQTGIYMPPASISNLSQSASHVPAYQQPVVYLAQAAHVPHLQAQHASNCVPRPTTTKAFGHSPSATSTKQQCVIVAANEPSDLHGPSLQHQSSSINVPVASIAHQNSLTQATSNETPQNFAKYTSWSQIPHVQQQQHLVQQGGHETTSQPNQVFYVAAVAPQPMLQYGPLHYDVAMQHLNLHQQPQHHQQYQAPTLMMTWKQRKLALGRSDRLRRIANELSLQDRQSQAWLGLGSDYGIGLNERDNTSASETSKSQHTRFKNSCDFNTQINLRNEEVEPYSARSGAHTQKEYSQQQSIKHENLNQSVHDLLSMFSGSAESQTLQKEPNCNNTDKQGPPDSAYVYANTDEKKDDFKQIQDNYGEVPDDFCDKIFQDKAKKESKPDPCPEKFLGTQITRDEKKFSGAKQTAGSPNDVQLTSETTNQFNANFFKEYSNNQKNSNNNGTTLEDDDSCGQMIFYDKSSCMHAPKANQVPIF